MEAQSELSDEKIIEIISSNSSTFRDLVYIIYSKFDELDSILHLFNITNFKISHLQIHVPPGYYDDKYTLITRKMNTYRASVISLGTKIIFDRHGVILSNLLTLIYFFVEYLRENRLELTEETKFPGKENIEAYNYINDYMPLSRDIRYDMNTSLKLFNNIDSHVVTGGRSVHFFISSVSSLPELGYLHKVVHIAGSKHIPVIIKIKISSGNPAVKSFLEDDHVIGPVLYGKHIKTIRIIEKKSESEYIKGNKIDLRKEWTHLMKLLHTHKGGSMNIKSKKSKKRKSKKKRSKKRKRSNRKSKTKRRIR